tara:strand:- start:332 stop:676 length:345 start_codon:yes stop_codon:yes gene_type:complete
MKQQFIKPLKMDKKGQLGLDTVKSVMISFLVLAVISIAVVLALVSLRDSNIFSGDPTTEAAVNDTIANVTSGVTDFFNDTGTIFSILIVVVIILAISIIIGVVSRFSGGGRGGL